MGRRPAGRGAAGARPVLPLRVLLPLLQLLLLLLCGAIPSVTACGPADAGAFKIGDTTYVCLVLNDEDFVLSTPRADQYSRLTVPASFVDNEATCREDLFHIESMGVRSDFRKRYCDEDLYFPVLTAIIVVDDGIVQSITWDDGCYFTDDGVSQNTEVCLANAFALNSTDDVDAPEPAIGADTALTRQACQSQSDASFCDLAVYVAWTGKDADGNYFASSGRRFSIFRQYALKTQFEAMRLFLLDET